MIDLKKLIEERDKREGELLNEGFLTPILSEIAEEIHKQSGGERGFADFIDTFYSINYNWSEITRSDIDVYTPIDVVSADEVCKLLTKNIPIYIFFYIGNKPYASFYNGMGSLKLAFFNKNAREDPKIKDVKVDYTTYSSMINNKGVFYFDNKKDLKDWLRVGANKLFDKMVVINMSDKNTWQIRADRFNMKQNYIPSSIKEREKYYKELLEKNISNYKARIKELRSLRDDWYEGIKGEIERILEQYGKLITKIHTDIRKYTGCQYKFDILTSNLFNNHVYKEYEIGLMSFIEEYTENKLNAVNKKSYTPTNFEKTQERLKNLIQERLEKCKSLLKEIEEEANSVHK